MSPKFQATIIGLILVNAALLGLETWPSAMAAAGGLLLALDRTILAVFVVEIALRIYVHRAAFWRDPWSLFDFAVVAIALVPAAGPFAVLRALRVLRVLRLLTMVPSMRRVVGALLAAIPAWAPSRWCWPSSSTCSASSAPTCSPTRIRSGSAASAARSTPCSR
jgi:voltage-gated sodium channel